MEGVTVLVPAQVRQEQADPEGHSQLPVRGLHEPNCRILHHRLPAAGVQDPRGQALCPRQFRAWSCWVGLAAPTPEG